MTDLFPEIDLEEVNRNLNNHAWQYGISFTKNDFISNTKLALEASEFAKENNKFYEFHNLVFRSYFSEGRDIGNLMVILEIANELGLDKNTLEKALKEHSFAPNVEACRKLAQENWVTTIPTFIIEGDQRIVGAQPYSKFKSIIEKLLSKP